MRTLGRFGMIALVILSCWSVSAAEQPNIFASAQYLQVTLPGHAPIDVRIPSSQKTVLLPLRGHDVLPLTITNERKAGTVRLSMYEPAARGEVEKVGTGLEEIASYRLQSRPNAGMTLHDLAIFGVDPIEVLIVERPNVRPLPTKCTCGTETCTPKAGQCVDCGCAICCAAAPQDE
jgi:hypothetical protein